MKKIILMMTLFVAILAIGCKAEPEEGNDPVLIPFSDLAGTFTDGTGSFSIGANGLITENSSIYLNGKTLTAVYVDKAQTLNASNPTVTLTFTSSNRCTYISTMDNNVPMIFSNN